MSRPRCPECGVRNQRDERFCRKCGAIMAPKRPMDRRLKLTLIAILLAYAFYFGIRWAGWVFTKG